MIKLLFLIIFLMAGPYSPRADEDAGNDQDFMKALESVKNPFDDGMPKPVVIIPRPVIEIPKPVPKPILQPVFVPKPVPVVVALPALTLQGVMVGDDMHEAIINDQIVPLQGTIEEATLIDVSKEGAELSYKGKKFFLKVD